MRTGLLFRAVCDQSQGTNSAELFAPAVAGSSDQSRRAHRPPAVIGGQKLKDALGWKKKEDSAFSFFTPSLLFALATASQRKYGGDTNLKIICFEASRATTLQGERAEFRLVSTVMEELGITMLRGTGDRKKFSDVVLSTTCVVPGNDVRVADFEQLEQQGLYELYPYLGENRFRDRPKLNRVIEQARDFGWQSERPLSLPKIGVAAQLAALFIGVRGRRPSSTQIDPLLLASLLSLQKRHSSDPALTCWLQGFSHEVIEIDTCEVEPEPARSSPVPEVAQQHDLMRALKSRQIVGAGLTGNSTIATTDLEQDAREFEQWRSMRDARYRAGNPRTSGKGGRSGG
ncbi:hypothetical protein CERZMDRAFT_85373 [Cercospora zeae-maydis SCOH1-5]|uniref:Uncharacterized protein n=1 Tax=Cercospora zeae-maydis SCOH1-5 TaxID=717836 RepID=A0A6A6FDZ1_9PEZI|nr:hypothetical protein CERZMDRAFT_85373 [Cercospora zeae-maydis SCOH1-5]